MEFLTVTPPEAQTDEDGRARSDDSTGEGVDELWQGASPIGARG